jgi:4-hydroxyphenylpyruvate dioxygenase-like putative hemolysin
MLKRVDRVQIVVRDRSEARGVAAAIFGAELIRQDQVKPLCARRSVLQAGSSIIEFLEPDGAGPIADFAARWNTGLYAVGFSVADVEAAAAHFDRAGVKYARDCGQLFLDASATGGMQTVISAFHERSPVGAIKWIFEVTNVVSEWRATAARYARIFALDPARNVPIEVDHFGYTGTLMMFDAPNRLDRIELSQPTREAAMGRFHQRHGDSLYMFYCETDTVEAIAERLQARGGRFTPRNEGVHDGLWIHPTAFCGVLVGLSRTNVAWRWSGDSERGR